MWAIASSLVLHNVRRSSILMMAAVAGLLIWSSVDPYTSDLDLMLGDLWHTRLALWSTVVISIVVLLQELPKEMSSKFHLILLSKPISRYGYFMGKLLGLYLFSLIYGTALVGVSFVSAFLKCEEPVPVVANVLLPWLHYSLYLWLFSLAAVVCGAFLNEAFCMICMGVFLTGSYIVGMLPVVGDASDIALSASLSMKAIYYCVPNFQYFGPSHFEDYGFLAPLYLFLYVLGYTGMLLPLALKKFESLSFQ